MYPPPYHQSKDIQKMITVIQRHPLGMLLSVHNGKPLVTHIPIIYNEKTASLVAHIDKHNPQVETLQNGAEVTVVFKGPDTYISPDIYTTKQLPTWNYIIVHITGTISLIDDPEAAKETMIAMTDFLEKPNHRFVLEKNDPRMERMIHYIQAFEIRITSWEGKFKLSQDKIPQDYENAKNVLLKKSGQDAVGFINSIYD